VNVQKAVEKTEEVEEEETEEWTAAQEEQAQQAYEHSLAQYYIYNLTRTFAVALLHLSTFLVLAVLVDAVAAAAFAPIDVAVVVADRTSAL
jgi:Flp pilus assembly protein TadB